jgi:hypothetical protein
MSEIDKVIAHCGEECWGRPGPVDDGCRVLRTRSSMSLSSEAPSLSLGVAVPSVCRGEAEFGFGNLAGAQRGYRKGRPPRRVHRPYPYSGRRFPE